MAKKLPGMDNKEDELHMAVRENNEEKVKSLICKGNVSVDCVYYGMTPLLVAISKDLSDIAVWLIEQGCDIHKLDVSGSSPFQEAIQHNLPQVVRVLAQKGIDVNSPLPDGTSPIVFATVKKHHNLLEAIMEGRANLDIKTPEGVTPLYIASKEGDKDTALSLIQAGADVNSLNGRNNLTPLMIAVIEEHDQLANLIMKQKGCNINQVDSGGRSALWHAVSNDNIQMVKALLSAGADVTLTDTEGTTVLQEAIESDQDDIVALLKTYTS